MVFENEQYKYVKIVAPHLPMLAEFTSKVGEDVEKKNIEFLLMICGKKFSFEGVLAHPLGFKPRLEEVILKTSILGYYPITLVKYAFKSHGYPGEQSFQVLEEYKSRAAALCEHFRLKKDIRVGRGQANLDKNAGAFYCLHGWIQGSVRTALAGYTELRDNLGKEIRVSGTLSYQ